jgi:hypothetical protein
LSPGVRCEVAIHASTGVRPARTSKQNPAGSSSGFFRCPPCRNSWRVGVADSAASQSQAGAGPGNGSGSLSHDRDRVVPIQKHGRGLVLDGRRRGPGRRWTRPTVAARARSARRGEARLANPHGATGRQSPVRCSCRRILLARCRCVCQRAAAAAVNARDGRASRLPSSVHVTSVVVLCDAGGPRSDSLFGRLGRAGWWPLCCTLCLVSAAGSYTVELEIVVHAAPTDASCGLASWRSQVPTAACQEITVQTRPGEARR